MSAWDDLLRRLDADPRDVGCAGTFELIHRYAEIVVTGGDPESLMPGVMAHLTSCGPCAEDYLGLLSVLEREANAQQD